MVKALFVSDSVPVFFGRLTELLMESGGEDGIPNDPGAQDNTLMGRSHAEEPEGSSAPVRVGGQWLTTDPL